MLVTDTAGRAWREGQTDLAIGAAGLLVLDDHAGRTDPYGNVLAVTAPAVADELAGAAELAAGKLGRRPFIVRARAGRPRAATRRATGPAPPRCCGRRAPTCSGSGAREAVLAALGAAPPATARRSARRSTPTTWSRCWPR